MRFILKGRLPWREEYGAFAAYEPEHLHLFQKGDEVTVCGIASEYCVLETFKNLYEISLKVGFTVKLWLGGTAKFDNYDDLLAFAAEKGLEVIE